MKKTVEVPKKKSIVPVVALLISIATVALTSAYVIYKYASDRSYRIKWQDYDDCGLA